MSSRSWTTRATSNATPYYGILVNIPATQRTSTWNQTIQSTFWPGPSLHWDTLGLDCSLSTALKTSPDCEVPLDLWAETFSEVNAWMYYVYVQPEQFVRVLTPYFDLHILWGPPWDQQRLRHQESPYVIIRHKATIVETTWLRRHHSIVTERGSPVRTLVYRQRRRNAIRIGACGRQYERPSQHIDRRGGQRKWSTRLVNNSMCSASLDISDNTHFNYITLFDLDSCWPLLYTARARTIEMCLFSGATFDTYSAISRRQLSCKVSYCSIWPAEASLFGYYIATFALFDHCCASLGRGCDSWPTVWTAHILHSIWNWIWIFFSISILGRSDCSVRSVNLVYV